jgi:trehalose-6-phosphatase
MWPDVSSRMSPTVARTLYVAAVRRLNNAVLSGRSLSFLKTSVIYLFSVSLMSCHGLERKPNVADVRMAFSY